MTHARAISSVLLGFSLVQFSHAQQQDNIKGAWELISQKFNGRESLSGRQIKLITDKHWAWVAQDTSAMSALLAKTTTRDSLRASYEIGGGAGSYTLMGNIYTEPIEFFPSLSYIGTSIPFTVKIEGDRLFQSGTLPSLGTDGNGKGVLLEEVYTKLE